MAIYSSVPPSDQQPTAHGVDIEAWTVEALQSLQISSLVQGTGTTLTIPLNDPLPEPTPKIAKKKAVSRESAKKRETLLKGKEGSRRRQRWENDRLLHVPNVQPPLPSDWEVHPTHPVHAVPYYLAPLWDSYAESSKQSKTKRQAARGEDTEKGRVPDELRMRLKKAKAAKGLLRALEEEVRDFVEKWEEEERKQTIALEKLKAEEDSEDEEIVFVGRDGRMSDLQKAEQMREREMAKEQERRVWDARVDESGAGFGRWLVHSIATYYGLTSRSVTVGNPARREAYVGIKVSKSGEAGSAKFGLPRPLYALI